MDFRRIPFNFTSTDPLKRQQELQRRFGLPVNKGNMFVDFANPGAMGTRSEISSTSNSPRLQHRVPIFVEGQSEPMEPSASAQNVDVGRKPHVRVIPIEIEGEDNAYKRHRSFSGSSEPINEKIGTSIPVQTFKHSVQEPVSRSPRGPRVCNIPIQIEGSDHIVKPKSPGKTNKVKSPVSPKHTNVKLNGCSASKVAKVNEQKDFFRADEKKESPEQGILKKIQNVEEKLKGYHADVEKFSGTNKEKQYRYLDEMLTRCMLELDEIDTMGLDTIRLARKAAVKKVQASVDLLELKVTKENQVTKEPMEVESTIDQALENAEDVDMQASDAEEPQTFEETNLETDNSNAEMSALPEQINEKVENISIVEARDNTIESSEDEPAINVNSSDESCVIDEKVNIKLVEPVQIAELETESGDLATSEVEPIVEEPLSDSKEDMDLDSCNCESDLKLDDTSIKICEIENCSNPDSNELEAEVKKTSDIPVVTEQTVISEVNVNGGNTHSNL